MLPLGSKFSKSLYSMRFFNFMIQSIFLNNCQSDFRPNHSYNNQLISITHNTFCGFDVNSSVEIFLDL